MKIKIICYNKMSKEYQNIYQYYVNKLKKFCQIDVIENIEFSNADIKSNMQKNEEILTKKMTEFKDYEFFLLETAGKQYTSDDFAKILSNNRDFKGAKILFLIGPSDGFSDIFKKQYQNQLSFGIQTSPYNLIRIILLEQLYRGFKINRNEKYHK